MPTARVFDKSEGIARNYRAVMPMLYRECTFQVNASPDLGSTECRDRMTHSLTQRGAPNGIAVAIKDVSRAVTTGGHWSSR